MLPYTCTSLLFLLGSSLLPLWLASSGHPGLWRRCWLLLVRPLYPPAVWESSQQLVCTGTCSNKIQNIRFFWYVSTLLPSVSQFWNEKPVVLSPKSGGAKLLSFTLINLCSGDGPTTPQLSERIGEHRVTTNGPHCSYTPVKQDQPDQAGPNFNLRATCDPSGFNPALLD